MKVSIIIPVYNMEMYLEECLKSVINQTLSDFEIICIDDCSTDRSLDILKEYQRKEPRLHIIKNERNKGLSYSRNKGVNVARGEFICFLDSDDSLEQNALAILCENAYQYVTDVLFFNGINEKEDGKKYDYYKTNYYGVMTGIEFLKTMILNQELRHPVCLQFWRRKSYDKYKLQFYEGIVHEDNLFTYYALVKVKRVVCISEKLYIRRFRKESLSHQKRNMVYLKSFLIIYWNLYRYWVDNPSKDVDMITSYYLKVKEYEINRVIDDLKIPIENIISELGENTVESYCLCKVLNIEKKAILAIGTQNVERLRKSSKNYIYGAGKIGKKVWTILNMLNISIDGFLITDIGSIPDIYNIPVFSFSEMADKLNNSLVIVGVGRNHREDIIEYLKKNHVDNVCILGESIDMC